MSSWRSELEAALADAISKGGITPDMLIRFLSDYLSVLVIAEVKCKNSPELLGHYVDIITASIARNYHNSL
jgi:hypothetical protein